MVKVPEYERQGFSTREEFNNYSREYRKTHKHIYKKIENQPKRVYARTKRQAEFRKINWDLSFEDFMSLWQKPCAYCGGEIITIGIDRVDSTKGYSLENIKPCCGWCNTMKLNHTTEELVSQCKKILSNLIN